MDRPVKILVIDDDEDDFVLTRELLHDQAHGMFIVEWAPSYDSGLAFLSQNLHELAFVDYRLGESDGVALIQEARAAGCRAPMILLTGHDAAEVDRSAMRAGAEDFLVKSQLTRVELDRSIRYALGRKQVADELLRARDELEIRVKERTAELAATNQELNKVLHALLPPSIADELRTTQAVRPQRHENVAVLFTDIVGFTSYCEEHPPEEVIGHLQQLVQECENIAVRYQLEKIKTIGDSFMATGGLLEPLSNPVINCVLAAREMAATAKRLPCGWRLHSGIHLGPVIAAVVGTRKYVFDVYGDTVNTAARIASITSSDCICISANAWQQVRTEVVGHSCGLQPMKGRGDVEVFAVENGNPVRFAGDHVRTGRVTVQG